MARHSQEVWENCIGNLGAVERDNGQVQWFDEQACDAGKRTSYSKKHL